MSGSGGGGPYGGSGFRETGCDIVEQVPLNSVQADVLTELQTNQALVVELRDNALVAAVSAGGEVAGSLTPSSLAALIRCIEKGHEYSAVVTRISGALVEVEIRPR